MKYFRDKNFMEVQYRRERDDKHDIHSGEIVLHGDETKGKELLLLQNLNHGRQNQDMDLQIRICNVCGRRFPSGQALGGHKSSHFQSHLGPMKINNQFKAKQQQVPQFPSLKSKISCSVCNKSFPSKNSLYGHMRSHRDRDWKGITPPWMKHKSSSSSSSSSFEDSDHNCFTEQDNGLINFLAIWEKKDWRDRESIRSNTLISNHTPNNNDFASKWKLNSSSEKLKSIDDFKHHVCKICNKTFPKGQALGGHMRVHSDGSAGSVLEAPTAQVASTDDEVGETIDPVVTLPLMPMYEEASRKLLEFALNEAPEED